MQIEDLKKYQKYLPSKRFVYSIAIAAGGLLLVFLVTSHIGYFTLFDRNPTTGKAPLSSNGDTVEEIVNRDSNDSGYPDWLQTLYGLNPDANGAANAKIIQEEQTAANITPGASTPPNATDEFSQELLSTIIAMYQSGNLTPDSITTLAASVGDGVDAKHSNPNTYSLSDITLSQTDDAAAKEAYGKALQSIVDQYNDVPLGSELTIISEGLENGAGDDALQQLQPISDAYAKMSKQIIGLVTPSSATTYALALANSTAEMGASLVQVQNFYTDVIGGMVGIDDYVKSSDASDTASQNMAAYLAN